MKLAQYEGELYLAMRHPDDSEVITDAPTYTIRDLLMDPSASGQIDESDPRLRDLQQQIDDLSNKLRTGGSGGIETFEGPDVVDAAPRYVEIVTWRGGITGRVQVKLPPPPAKKEDGPL